MKYSLFVVLLVLAATIEGEPVASAAEQQKAQPWPSPFFSFDNGTGRGQLTPVQQAKMLKQLGYDGIGYTGTQGIPEMLSALDQVGLKMFSTYVRVDVGPEGPRYDPGLPEAIKQLKGRETIIWLYILGKGPDAEERTIRMVREVADMAARSGLSVATYPHTGFYVGRVEDSVRIAKKVDRPNVGASFNLCHWLKVDGRQLHARLTETMPYLYLVSINGADAGDTRQMGWDRLIQTLDRGTYDIAGLLTQLRALGYRGPIGLQCYNVRGDREENLRRSIAAWREMTKQVAGP